MSSYPVFPRRTPEEEAGGRIMTETVKAGKRTYFFDVHSTRNADDYYITVTESRKKIGEDGTPLYLKQKIYLYKEDFAKFARGLEAAVDFVKTANPEYFAQAEQAADDDGIDFDNL